MHVQQQPLVHTGSIRPSKIVGRTCVSRKIFNKICPQTTRRSTYYHLRLRLYLTLYVMLPLNFKGTCNYYPVFCIQNFQIGIKLGVYFFGMFTRVLHLTLLFFHPVYGKGFVQVTILMESLIRSARIDNLTKSQIHVF